MTETSVRHHTRCSFSFSTSRLHFTATLVAFCAVTVPALSLSVCASLGVLFEVPYWWADKVNVENLGPVLPKDNMPHDQQGSLLSGCTRKTLFV